MQANLLSSNFEQAAAEVDSNEFLQKKRNRLLYLFEKGKLEHLNGNYESSNKYFEEAYILIDDEIKTNAGQTIAANLTNPMAMPYKGEDFEKVTLHYYKALNYFQLGDPNAALVEAKRINIKLQELNQRYKENKNKYDEDAFSQILQGILYEATGDINNAFIAYRNAAELYLDNNGQYFGVPMPEQLQKDLLRTSKILGFQNEHNQYKEQFGLEYEAQPTSGEAIVFWENGLGPVKDQTILTASGAGGGFVGTIDDESIYIPIPSGVNIGINALAIPKYAQRESYYKGASIIYDDNEMEFEVAESFFPIARQCLKDRMMREVVNMAIRFGSKKVASKGIGMLADHFLGGVAGDIAELGADAAGAATEKADTRNWQTLPATISYARVPLKEDRENIFVIKKRGPASVIDYDTLHVPYKRGLQIVNYFDLGRTTSNFVVPPASENLNGKTSENLAQTTDTSLLEEGGSFKTVQGSAEDFKDVVILKAAPEGVSVESIFNSYIDAIGGRVAVENLASVTRTFKTSYADIDMVTKTTNTRKGEVIIEVSGNSVNMKTYFDGEKGYTEMMGSKTDFTKEQNEMYKNSTAMIPELKIMENVKLLGMSNLDGEDVYVIQYSDGKNQSKELYSVNSGLKLRSVSSAKYLEQSTYVTVDYVDYKSVNGILFPHVNKTTSYTAGNIVTMDIKYNITVNEGTNTEPTINETSSVIANNSLSESPSRILEENETIPNTATVYIIRKGKMAGSAVKIPFFCNNELFCKLRNKRYDTFKVTPGTLTMQIKPQGWASYKSDPIQIDVTAGETYYVFVETNLYNANVDYRMMDEVEASEYLNDYKMNK
ncbi:MAG TPA: hypothetical protein VFM70_04210 [Salinimicrobium sp.]|nr:hypothetical protein [Salinimicrobium sp.]